MAARRMLRFGARRRLPEPPTPACPPRQVSATPIYDLAAALHPHAALLIRTGVST